MKGHWWLVVVPVLALLVAACQPAPQAPAGPSVPLPSDAREVSSATMSGEEAADLLFLDPGGELAKQSQVTVKTYEVLSPSEVVVDFYTEAATGWESAFTTSFDQARIFIWETPDESATVWISIVPAPDPGSTNLIIIQT